jgi:hypothetical protein
MNTVHLLLPDLFLSEQIAAAVSADLALPNLRKLLARATRIALPNDARSLEQTLCAAFALSLQNDVPIAPISAAFDGLEAGIWLRADPVNLRLQRDQMLLSQTAVSASEASEVCAALNDYFAGQGMIFAAPHPQRWYVRLDRLPDMHTTPLNEVIGANVRGALPQGKDAAHWHQIFNELQMFLHAHPLNQGREARGELQINSLWLWGAGSSVAALPSGYTQVAADDELAQMFAAHAQTECVPLGAHWQAVAGAQLLLFSGLRRALQNGDLQTWREALQQFEIHYAQPLLAALSAGQLQSLQLDVLAGEHSARFNLRRAATWRVWRRNVALAAYSKN